MLMLVYSAGAQSRDLVVMKNGDHITGKIKKLDHGQLYIETAYTVDEIPVDWLQVKQIKSSARFQLETSGGKRLAGIIEKVSAENPQSMDFSINSDGHQTLLRATDVVTIEQQKRNFWRQMKGSVNFGYSYDSGSTNTSTDVNASTTYTSTKYQLAADLNSSVSGQTDSGRTNRQDISTTSAFYLSRHAFVGSLLDFLISDQQSIDLRQTYGGGYGRYIIRSNTTEFSWLGGIAYVNEAYNPTAGLNPNDQNAEGLLALNFDWFRFNTSQLGANFQLFPGLTDAGRIRSNLNASFLIKLKHDLNLTFNFWDTFDSTPPVNAKENEFGMSTTFGISF